MRSIVTKYSDHISIPVELYKAEVPERDGPDDKKIPAEPAKWEVVNKATAMWTREKSDVSDEEYNEFYKHVSHDYADPLTWSHNKVEGKTEYTSLLYIPSKAPFDLWNREQTSGLKLYVQRVFIMDDAEQFMPTYLRFVKGLLDSNDLPLNVSRELLQDNKITQSIRQGCTKRVLTMLEKMAKNDAETYQSFYNEFGNVLKEGPAEDFANKDKIAGLLRFASTHNEGDEQTVSLAQYIERMQEGQEKIFYVTADSYQTARTSPHLEMFRKKGIEVLLLGERIDEWLMSHLNEFDGKTLQSAASSSADLSELDDDETKKAKEEAEKAIEGVLERMKTALGDKVETVKFTHRLTDSPACIVATDDGMTTQMAKLMQAAGQPVPEPKYSFELNPEHQLVKMVSEVQDEEQFKQWTQVLFDQAALSEQGSLKAPADFVKNLNALLVSLVK